MMTSVGRAVWLLYQLPEDRRAKIGRTLLLGVGIFASGFGIWNLDNYFCVYLRDVRSWLVDHGLQHLGHFTEGHGYWHLMTSYGSLLSFCACIRECSLVFVRDIGC
jgi:dihydroceramidase